MWCLGAYLWHAIRGAVLIPAQLRKCRVMDRHATLWLSRWCGFLVMTPVVAMADVWSMVAIVWVSECAVEHGGITAKRFSCP